MIIDLHHPDPLTVAGWVRHHLDEVVSLSPGDLDRLAKAAREAERRAQRRRQR